MPHTGENLDPPVPQAEGVGAALLTAVGNTRLAAPREALALVGEDAFLRRGAVTNARDMLVQFDVDLRDAEARFFAEGTRLAAGWRQLDTPAKEAHDKAKVVHVEG
ncbi:hypothetical protein D1007_20781 [Hordeum vulgare]|nr:hypothetical protein D1007_20781 [Hordeum vulgare]